MICPYCRKEATWTSNEVVYGRPFGKSFMCYYCAPCDAYVGCHNNTKKSLGTMANKALRAKRIAAHNAIDPLWRDGQMTRREVYGWLSEKLGWDVHVGAADEAQCDLIIKTAPTLTKPLSK